MPAKFHVILTVTFWFTSIYPYKENKYGGRGHMFTEVFIDDNCSTCTDVYVKKIQIAYTLRKLWNLGIPVFMPSNIAIQ